MEILIASCVFIVTTIDVVYCRNPSPAKLLFKHDHQTQKFVLQGDGLAELEQLKAPVRVMRAIGDSRVGKSTNLNFIRHFLDQNREGCPIHTNRVGSSFWQRRPVKRKSGRDFCGSKETGNCFLKLVETVRATKTIDGS